MAVRMIRAVRTATGSYEAGDIITGLSPIMEAQLLDGGDAVFAPLQASVSEYGTFGDLLAVASPAAGQRARVSGAVIPGGPTYTRWVYDGALWRLDGEQDLLLDVTPSTGTTGTTEQQLKSYALPAGLLLSLRRVRMWALLAKSSTAEAVTTVRLRLGATNTASDATIASAAGLPTSTGRVGGFDHHGFAADATTWRQMYANGGGGLGGAASSSLAYPANVTVASLAAATYLQVCMQMAASAESPTVAHVLISAA